MSEQEEKTATETSEETEQTASSEKRSGLKVYSKIRAGIVLGKGPIPTFTPVNSSTGSTTGD